MLMVHRPASWLSRAPSRLLLGLLNKGTDPAAASITCCASLGPHSSPSRSLLPHASKEDRSPGVKGPPAQPMAHAVLHHHLHQLQLAPADLTHQSVRQAASSCKTLRMNNYCSEYTPTGPQLRASICRRLTLSSSCHVKLFPVDNLSWIAQS